MDNLLAKSDLATRWGLPLQWVEWRSKEDKDFPPVRMRVDNGNMTLYLLKEIMVYEKEKRLETETINIKYSKDIRLSEGIRLALEDDRQLTYNETTYIEGLEKVFNRIKDIKYNGTVYLDELLFGVVMTGKDKGTHVRYHTFGKTHTFFRFKTRIKKKNNQIVYTFHFLD